MTELGTKRIDTLPGGEKKARGAGQPPRKYTTTEWVKGYAMWLVVLPLYLGLWAFAMLVPQLPEWARKLLLRNHDRTINSRPNDVRIPGTPSIPAYMLRWWKIKRNAYFNAYYHIVKRSDDDTALHDHPWWNFSIVLTGGYYEHRILEGGIHSKTWYGPGSVLFRRRGGYAHRLELPVAGNQDGTYRVGNTISGFAEQEARTIFITGPVLRRWGFHHPEQWVDAYDWDDFLAARGIASMRMEGYAEQQKKGE